MDHPRSPANDILRTVVWARVICTTTLRAGLPGRSTTPSASAATGKPLLAALVLSIMPLSPTHIIHVPHACMDVCRATTEQSCDLMNSLSALFQTISSIRKDREGVAIGSKQYYWVIRRLRSCR